MKYNWQIITITVLLILCAVVLLMGLNEQRKRDNLPQPTKEEQCQSLSKRMNWRPLKNNGHDFLFYFLDTGNIGGVIHDPDCTNPKHQEKK